jgi:hypothetical protein
MMCRSSSFIVSLIHLVDYALGHVRNGTLVLSQEAKKSSTAGVGTGVSAQNETFEESSSPSSMCSFATTAQRASKQL